MAAMQSLVSKSPNQSFERRPHMGWPRLHFGQQIHQSFGWMRQLGQPHTPCVTAQVAYVPAMSTSPSTSSSMMQQPRGSLDPLAASWEKNWEPGCLVTVKSPQQFTDLLQMHPDKLVVLMCKSHSCRPCKMFTRKYMSTAQRFPECVLAEIYGDETPETRKMMMQMDVRVTPTFRMYRAGECVNVVTGISDKKLMRGMLAQLGPSELVNHAQEISDTMSYDEGDQQQQQPAVVPAPSPAN